MRMRGKPEGGWGDSGKRGVRARLRRCLFGELKKITKWEHLCHGQVGIHPVDFSDLLSVWSTEVSKHFKNKDRKEFMEQGQGGGAEGSPGQVGFEV